MSIARISQPSSARCPPGQLSRQLGAPPSSSAYQTRASTLAGQSLADVHPAPQTSDAATTEKMISRAVTVT